MDVPEPPGDARTLTLSVLGQPSVRWGGARLGFPTRKSLGLVCYLAVTARPASRAELSELLWAGQRRNLRTALHRLRQLPGSEDWLQAGDAVALLATSDVAAFRSALGNAKFQEALELYRGEPEKRLLDGLELPGNPAFVDWLEAEQAQLDAGLRDALRGAAETRRAVGDAGGARDLLRELLALDPLDESAHRRVMQLAFEAGQVQEALAQFEACRRTLAQELGLAPLPETLALADEIERAVQVTAGPVSARVRPRIPPKLLRPPRLAGRAPEWARMEDALEAGEVIVLAGASGVGKTRLMMDFVRAKGSYLLLDCRPGDAALPLSSLGRAITRHFDEDPQRLARLEPWVRVEASRLLPHRAQPRPPPMSSDEDRLRFAEAMVRLVEVLGDDVDFLATDDLQLCDQQSFEVATRAWAATRHRGHRFPRAIVCLRSGSVPEPFEAGLEQLTTAGHAVRIDLGPLAEDGVRSVLDGLEITAPDAFASSIHRLTGGNPQFIVEVLKALHESGDLAGAIDEPVRFPASVKLVVERRLGRLSNEALRVAQAMAAWRSPTDVASLARSLASRPLEVATGLDELRDAQIAAGTGFVHDVIFETVRASTPVELGRLLHRSVAETLEEADGEAALIAHHWLEAGERPRALPWCLAAARSARDQGAVQLMRRWLDLVIEEAPQASRMAVQALLLLGKQLSNEDVAAAAEPLSRALRSSRAGGFPDLEAACLVALAERAARAGEAEHAATLLEEATDLASALEESDRAALLHAVSGVHWHLGDFASTEAAIVAAVASDPDQRDNHLMLAMLRWHQGRYKESVATLLRLLRRDPEAARTSLLSHDLGVTYWALGEFDKARHHLEQCVKVFGVAQNPHREAMARMGLAMVQVSTGRYVAGERLLQRVRSLFEQQGAVVRRADAEVRLAYLRIQLERYQDAAELFESALDALRHAGDPYLYGYALSLSAGAQTGLGRLNVALAQATEGLELAERTGQALATIIALRASAVVALATGAAPEANRYADRAILLAETCEMREHLAYARLLRAQALPELAHEEAVHLAMQALASSRSHDMPHLASRATAVLHELTSDEAYRPNAAKGHAWPRGKPT